MSDSDSPAHATEKRAGANGSADSKRSASSAVACRMRPIRTLGLSRAVAEVHSAFIRLM